MRDFRYWLCVLKLKSECKVLELEPVSIVSSTYKDYKVPLNYHVQLHKIIIIQASKSNSKLKELDLVK
ncbi:hypothetical protein AQUCO_01600444v1 [Aquilegia coerulea]|uniref:Uncharacterized protein n=1 Tax=Aquilegia coerulea TaxID=218851 RepID=A0A2G5DRM6_AQUCA|nr:hypothetical protein AQUCO_01600444v1 [Aquilegia coerulea]